MRVTNGFVYYFTIATIALTISQILLCIKPIRHLFFNISKKLKLVDFPIYQLGFWIVFLIICIVLADAVTTYLSLKDTLGGMFPFI